MFDFDDNDDDDDDDFFQNLSLSKHASAPVSNLETTVEDNEKVKNVYDDDAEESKTEENTEFTDGENFKDEENRTDIKRFVEDDKDDFIVSFDCLQKKTSLQIRHEIKETLFDEQLQEKLFDGQLLFVSMFMCINAF